MLATSCLEDRIVNNASGSSCFVKRSENGENGLVFIMLCVICHNILIFKFALNDFLDVNH